jgi:hypothetical protein
MNRNENVPKIGKNTAIVDAESSEGVASFLFAIERVDDHLTLFCEEVSLLEIIILRPFI